MQREDCDVKREEKRHRAIEVRASSEASTIPATSPQLKTRTMMRAPYQPEDPDNEASSEDEDSPPLLRKNPGYPGAGAREPKDVELTEALHQLVKARKRAGSTCEEVVEWVTERIQRQWWSSRGWEHSKAELMQEDSAIGFDESGTQET